MTLGGKIKHEANIYKKKQYQVNLMNSIFTQLQNLNFSRILFLFMEPKSDDQHRKDRMQKSEKASK